MCISTGITMQELLKNVTDAWIKKEDAISALSTEALEQKIEQSDLTLDEKKGALTRIYEIRESFDNNTAS